MPSTTRPDLVAGSVASLAAAAVALLIQIADPFEHGAWLVAYLGLIGFAAQLLLAIGQTALLSAGAQETPSRQARLAQALLWNFGVIAVPAGVLVGARLAVAVGSLALLAALVSLWATVRSALPGAAPPTRLGWAYVLLLLAMTLSTLIGTALAWDIPWT